MRAAGSVDEEEEAASPSAASPMLTSVVLPAISQAEKVFCEALARISIEDMVVRAAALMKPEPHQP